MSSKRSTMETTFKLRSTTMWLSARDTACCSNRSRPKTSARIGSVSSHGAAERRVSQPSRAVRFTTSHASLPGRAVRGARRTVLVGKPTLHPAAVACAASTGAVRGGQPDGVVDRHASLSTTARCIALVQLSETGSGVFSEERDRSVGAARPIVGVHRHSSRPRSLALVSPLAAARRLVDFADAPLGRFAHIRRTTCS